MTEIEVIRAQLNTAIKFMGNTPKIDGYMWEEGMPGYPELYDPDDWVEGGFNSPMSRVWDDFLNELAAEGMYERQAKAMAITPLLAKLLED